MPQAYVLQLFLVGFQCFLEQLVDIRSICMMSFGPLLGLDGDANQRCGIALLEGPQPSPVCLFSSSSELFPSHAWRKWHNSVEYEANPQRQTAQTQDVLSCCAALLGNALV
eukprot:5985299-Amphidinium_carterae.1